MAKVMSTFEFEFFTVDLPEEWADVTASLGVENAPITLALPDGVGALQFSVGRYVRGERPDPTHDILVEMLIEFGKSKSLGEPKHFAMQAGRISIAAASFSADGDFVRVWYLSDGLDFAIVTYACEMGSELRELEACEQIVRSLEFTART